VVSPASSWRIASDVLAVFPRLLDGLDAQVKAVNLDRGFYNSTCLELLYVHNYAYAMPIVKWGETIQDELSRSWSGVIEHELAGRVTFPVFINCTYQRGRYNEFDNDQFSGRWTSAPVVCGESPPPERLAVSPLEVRGGASPREAPPLEVAVRRVL